MTQGQEEDKAKGAEAGAGGGQGNRQARRGQRAAFRCRYGEKSGEGQQVAGRPRAQARWRHEGEVWGAQGFGGGRRRQGSGQWGAAGGADLQG